MTVHLVKPSILLAVVAALVTPLTSQAAPIVQQGTTYHLSVFSNSHPGIYLNQVIFDGLDEVRVVNGRTLTLGESQTDLGQGRWEIRLSLVSDVDIAPGPLVASSFGLLGDPLDLLLSVRLVSLVQTWTGFDPNGSAFVLSNEVAGTLSDIYRNPWNGAFGNPPGNGYGYGGIEGWDFRSVSYTALVQRVPAPGSLLLSSLALLALAARRSRR